MRRGELARDVQMALESQCSLVYHHGPPLADERGFKTFLVMSRQRDLVRNVAAYARFREQAGLWTDGEVWWSLVTERAPTPSMGALFYVRDPRAGLGRREE